MSMSPEALEEKREYMCEYTKRQAVRIGINGMLIAARIGLLCNNVLYR